MEISITLYLGGELFILFCISDAIASNNKLIPTTISIFILRYMWVIR